MLGATPGTSNAGKQRPVILRGRKRLLATCCENRIVPPRAVLLKLHMQNLKPKEMLSIQEAFLFESRIPLLELGNAPL